MQEGGPEAAMAAISDGFLSNLAADRQRRGGRGHGPPLRGERRDLAVPRRHPKTDFDATLEALAGSLG